MKSQRQPFESSLVILQPERGKWSPLVLVASLIACVSIILDLKGRIGLLLSRKKIVHCVCTESARVRSAVQSLARYQTRGLLLIGEQTFRPFGVAAPISSKLHVYVQRNEEIKIGLRREERPASLGCSGAKEVKSRVTIRTNRYLVTSTWPFSRSRCKRLLFRSLPSLVILPIDAAVWKQCHL